MPARVRPDDADNDDYYSQQDYGRRHRSQPPRKNRVRDEERPQRPKYAKDDSYYNPRDKYYLSGDDEPDFHPYFASRKEESPPRRREKSPSRHRYEPSPTRYASPSRYESPPRRRQASPTRSKRPANARTRSYSVDSAPPRRRADNDDYDTQSRRDLGGASSSRHRSSSTAPSKADPDGDYRRSRRDSARYPPSSSRSHREPKRSSTQPASAQRGRTRSASRPSSPSSRRSKKERSQDVFASATRAALAAGAMAAAKLNDDPSPWIGLKGTKVVTTALGAALVDTFIEQRKPELRGGMRHKLTKQAATFALGNLLTKPAAKHGLAGHHVQERMK